MRVSRLLLASATCVAAVSTSAGSAEACSLAPAPSVEEVVSADPLTGIAEADVVLGVYEFEHIARSSGVLGDRSVTVITRYWGEPPDDLGARLVRTDCGSWVRNSGTVGYWWIDAFHAERFAGWRSSLTLEGTVEGLDARQSELLAARFGDPVEVDVSTSTRIWALALAWQWELILLAAAALAAGLVVRRRSATPTEAVAAPTDASD